MSDKPALLGGTPIRAGAWPSWPVSDSLEMDGLSEVLQSGKWYRYAAGEHGKVAEFERQWAADVGVPYCQATSSGTSSLVCALAALDIGPGDEVLVPPYTFIATINAVLVHHALPVFVDTDPDTALMDPDTLEGRINSNTRAILPVHIAGTPCDLDRILAIAGARSLKVIEDACQAHTAAWNGRRVGSLGDAGCFSFQNSKNITSGDGGALTTNDSMIYARAQAFQNNGSSPVKDDGVRTSNGMNLRLTEFQGALLLAQLTRNEMYTRRREENGAHLNDLLNAIPGVRAKRTYPGTTRHGYHLYMFDYDPEQFLGMSKALFLKALAAEGVPASGGYSSLNKQPFVEQFLTSRSFQRVYSRERLKQYRDENVCPANDAMIERTCWLTQNVLLGSRDDMESIAEAVSRVQQHAGELVRTFS
ncbi:MAG: DegT/DnrJ/EryC1/StrS family aminotransferase [Planctomycetaceae bacterium]|nr:DegT/DnrJ/EryC1/StrS family aminotransferase [Planctomycetaceae bacterium]